MTIVSFRVNNLFTEFGKLEATIGKESARALRTLGAQLRTRIKRQVRRRKGPSQPGQSPHAHAPGNSGLRRVEFKLESNFNLVVGAVKYGKQLQDRPVPNIHEQGGTVVAQREGNVQVQFIKRGRRLIAVSQGREIQSRLPRGLVERSGLLVDQSTGKFLPRGAAIAARIQMRREAVKQAQRVGKVRRYPKRPVAKPVLDRALRDGVIPRQFNNLLRGL